jgi:hypothetical protein
MKTFVSVAAALLFSLVWAERAKAVAYCPPEYQSCEGSGTPGGWGGGQMGGVQNGPKTYGYPYLMCVATAEKNGKCWECVWNPNKHTETCGGVYHTAGCSCTEKYENYIIYECSTYGTCDYSD